MITAMIAVYPLHTGSSGAIRYAIEAIESEGVAADTGPMSTVIAGTPDEVFRALRRAYEAAAAAGSVVVHVTVSNACPIPSARPERSAPVDPAGEALPEERP
jgi:uncharacterized protein YqgV (UPF0045/DUF77 family)